MAQSLTKIYLHLIFHVKTTSPAISEDDLADLHAYIGKLVNTTGCQVLCTGGVRDHVHVLFCLARDVAVSYVVEEVKRNSSRWLKTRSPMYHRFAWQNGYAAFSVSQSVVDTTIAYIENQRQHHHKTSFADEYRKFLDVYQVKYNEKYIFRD